MVIYHFNPLTLVHGSECLKFDDQNVWSLGITSFRACLDSSMAESQLATEVAKATL